MLRVDREAAITEIVVAMGLVGRTGAMSVHTPVAVLYC